jgi:alkylhydroperoxidase/carboxymuconolactone decarboxylase family protein YurZ
MQLGRPYGGRTRGGVVAPVENPPSPLVRLPVVGDSSQLSPPGRTEVDALRGQRCPPLLLRRTSLPSARSEPISWHLASPELLPLDEAAEAQRASRVGEQFGKVASGVVQYTTDVLFRDLWLRPDLVRRDRSLVTVSALIASGQVAQLGGHLNRAMDNGLTQAQAAEASGGTSVFLSPSPSHLPRMNCPCGWLSKRGSHRNL